MQALKHNVWIVALSLMLALFLGQTSRAAEILWADPLDPQVSVAFVGQNFSVAALLDTCLLYTSPSPRDATLSRMPSSA